MTSSHASSHDRPRRCPTAVAIGVVIFVWAVAGSPAVLAAAQEDGAQAEPYLARPPEIVSRRDAVLPAGTVFPTPEVVVVLEIEVDEAGRVGEVRVTTGAGAPFDGAASDAARGFTFRPGLLDTGEAVPVTVTYRMRILEPPPPPPPPVTFRAQLLVRGTRTPLEGVPVAAKVGDETLAQGQTDAEGWFTLEVPAATFTIVAVPTGHQRLDVMVEAEPGEEREERFYLEEETAGLAIVVRAEPIRREVTKRVISRELVQTLPGTAGDTIKVVQSLPGVSRSRYDGGELILRGANPGDSLVFLEGLEIPLIYHFGGLRSTFNSWFLDAVEFVPGNFPVDYGRATGGVIDVTVRDPSRDLFRGEIDINVYDAGFALEGPVGDEWSLGGAFHRSYIDSILPFVLPDDAPISFDTAPRYYDYQLIAAWKPDDKHHARAIWYGSMDKIVLVLEESGEGSVKVRDAVSARILFHFLQLEYDAAVTDWLKQESTVAFGFQQIETEIGPEFFFNLDVWRVNLRTAWTAKAFDWLDVRVGADLAFLPVTVRLTAPNPPKEGEPSVPLAVQDTLTSEQSVVWYQPAAFLELQFQPTSGVYVVPGVRLDWLSAIDRVTVDPRLTARWEIVPGTTVKGGVGLFQRQPDPDEVAEETGNPDLFAERAVQASVGVEQALFDVLTVEVTGFYKWLDRLVVPNRGAQSGEPPYTNDGVGRIFGVELLVRANVPDWFEGWLAYTWQRSFRRNGPGEAERLFDFDQPHILTVVGRVDLGRGWSVGARFRLVSGNPDTPINGSIFDAATDTFVPIFGATNTIRQALFHQLDLRVDKVWTFDTWKLDVYLDIQNVYYHANQEGWSYDYDYTNRTEQTGIPILPIFGVRGEW